MNKVTFLEKEHLYLNSQGIIIPSVTQLVSYEYPNGYSEVPAFILKNKASYGTKVHQKIEAFENGEFTLEELNYSRVDPNIKSAVNQYAKLKKENPKTLNVESMEQIVSYNDRFAGTYDILTRDGILVDIKTTVELHKDWLALQLGLYYLALGVEKNVGYCLWVPRSQPASLILIEPWSNKGCLELLERYEKEHSTKEY